MSKMKISIKDFKCDQTLSQHSRQSKQVARALDTKARTLPSAKVFTSHEFEEFLSQLTPKRFELLRLASQGGRSSADLAAAAANNPQLYELLALTDAVRSGSARERSIAQKMLESRLSTS